MKRLLLKITILFLSVSTILVFSSAGCKGEAEETAREEVIQEQIPTEIQESPVYMDPNASIEDRVEELLSLMTLEEKIGQMTQIERIYISGDVIAEYYIGSVLSGGGSSPLPNSPESWADMYDNLQESALSTRLAIPIIYGIDAIHGNNKDRK